MAQLALLSATNDLILSTGKSDPTNRLLWSEALENIPPWGAQNCNLAGTRVSNGKLITKIEDVSTTDTGIYFQSILTPVRPPTHYTYSVLIVKDSTPRATRFVGFMSNLGTANRTEMSLDTMTGEWVISLNAGDQAIVNVLDEGAYWKVIMTEANINEGTPHWRIIPALGASNTWVKSNVAGSVEVAECYLTDGILNFPYTYTEDEYIPPIDIVTGGVERVRGGRYTVQQVQSRLRTFFGEWLLDQKVGWLKGTDFDRNFDQFDIENRARRIILSTKGVKEIIFLRAEYVNRKLEITFEADTVYARIFKVVAF